jgi:hypothetical protein
VDTESVNVAPALEWGVREPVPLLLVDNVARDERVGPATEGEVVELVVTEKEVLGGEDLDALAVAEAALERDAEPEPQDVGLALIITLVEMVAVGMGLMLPATVTVKEPVSDKLVLPLADSVSVCVRWGVPEEVRVGLRVLIADGVVEEEGEIVLTGPDADGVPVTENERDGGAVGVVLLVPGSGLPDGLPDGEKERVGCTDAVSVKLRAADGEAEGDTLSVKVGAPVPRDETVPLMVTEWLLEALPVLLSQEDPAAVGECVVHVVMLGEADWVRLMLGVELEEALKHSVALEEDEKTPDLLARLLGDGD